VSEVTTMRGEKEVAAVTKAAIDTEIETDAAGLARGLTETKTATRREKSAVSGMEIRVIVAKECVKASGQVIESVIGIVNETTENVGGNELTRWTSLLKCVIKRSAPREKNRTTVWTTPFRRLLQRQVYLHLHHLRPEIVPAVGTLTAEIAPANMNAGIQAGLLDSRVILVMNLTSFHDIEETEILAELMIDVLPLTTSAQIGGATEHPRLL
jgi:hypothetical protein